MNRLQSWLSRCPAACGWWFWLVVGIVLAADPVTTHAQMFLASDPNPKFRVGPLFIRARVEDQNREHGCALVTVAWDIVPADDTADPADPELYPKRDLYLVWPGELLGIPTANKAPLEPRGRKLEDEVKEMLPERLRRDFHPHLTDSVLLMTRPRTTMGQESSSQPGDGVRLVPDRGSCAVTGQDSASEAIRVPFVTFTLVRNATANGRAGANPSATHSQATFLTLLSRSLTPFGGGEARTDPRESRRESRPVTVIRIPWTEKKNDALWRLRFAVKELITDKPASWFEEAFRGDRHVASVSFGDVGSMALYNLYLAGRDRVVRLGHEFSQLSITFSDRDHLIVDEIAPATARRRPGEWRRNSESVALAIAGSDGFVPHVLEVQFSYFRGWLAWRPLVVPLLFLVAGNFLGPLVGTAVKRAARTVRARIQVGRVIDDPRRRQTGTVVARDTIARILPGETTYDDVVKLCGAGAEEQHRLGPKEQRILFYRGQRLVPHRGRTIIGWVTTVSHWETEHHELEVVFEQERVVDIQARMRRCRALEPTLVTAGGGQESW
jgi:hypothetical protein